MTEATLSELADLLTNLYALRSSCGAAHVTANTHRLLSVATLAAAAGDDLSSAIEHLEKKIAERKESTCNAV
jgi:hypothetical protein